MEKVVTLTAVLLTACAAGAVGIKCVPGEVIVKFESVLNLSEGAGGVRTQYGSINKLNETFGVKWE